MQDVLIRIYAHAFATAYELISSLAQAEDHAVLVQRPPDKLLFLHCDCAARVGGTGLFCEFHFFIVPVLAKAYREGPC